MPSREKELHKDDNLHGNALRVYAFLYLSADRTVGIRSIQRAVGFSSPSSVIYQLEKLIGLDLVKKNSFGEYSLTRHRKVGILVHYTIVLRRFIPIMMIHALTVTLVTLSILIFLIVYGNTLSILVVIPSFIAAILMWVEGKRMWVFRPQFESNRK